jgi:hypothetical protein
VTKDEFFAEIKALEEKAFELVGGGSEDEFDKTIARTEELVVIAKREGWIA